MSENQSRVLLVLPRDMLDSARTMSGTATAALKLTVSLQIVLRALIVEGLKRAGDRRLLANIEMQTQAVRRIRSLARTGRRAAPSRGSSGRRRARSEGGDRRRA
jgi:hypothetical protein